MTNKIELYAWGCSKLREAVDQKMHGNVIINLKDGEIRGIETQRFDKPPVDRPQEMA